VVALKFTQFDIHVEAVREREVQHLVAEQVEAVGLVGHDGADLVVEASNKRADRLDTVGAAVGHHVEGPSLTRAVCAAGRRRTAAGRRQGLSRGPRRQRLTLCRLAPPLPSARKPQTDATSE
jgi:hypothetical protein